MKIKIPSLVINQKETIGEIKHIFFTEHEASVVKESEVKISPKISEKLFKLDTGQKIIVTKRKLLSRPKAADGVLYQENGKNKWLFHKLTERFEKKAAKGSWDEILQSISQDWKHTFKYLKEKKDKKGATIASGLRAPQIGALHAIGSHWSLSNKLATISMPTGTGKTEVMLSVLYSLIEPGDKLLIIVPNKALLEQTVNKFLKLGILKKIGVIPKGVDNSVVGIIRHRPKQVSNLDIINKCHVVISIPNSISTGTAEKYLPELAKRCSCLIIDEAHHVPSTTWTALKEAFRDKAILQFTATPWRSDRQPIEGKTIFNYPLGQAQKDDYFTKITFSPILSRSGKNTDELIAKAAIKQLEKDLLDKKDHLVMARCKDIKKAEKVFNIYKKIAQKYNPVLVHSENKSPDSIKKLRSGKSKILVCVNMFGEGFDLPKLKIAAVHDCHKSIAPLLQFIGRFTRTSNLKIGNATFIANIANNNISSAYEALFSEDTDWNKLLSEISSDFMKSHMEVAEFLNNSKRLDDESEDPDTASISPSAITPRFNTQIFKCTRFLPNNFIKAFDNSLFVIRAAWLNDVDNVLFFVTRSETRTSWGRSKSLTDRSWDLFVAYYNKQQKLLFIHTSDNDIKIDKLAETVGEVTKVSGDTIFRILGNIKRLIFQRVGLKKHGGRRNLRYASYNGTDVRRALSPAQTANSSKSDVSGDGYEGGKAVTIGCSYKGRIWSRDKGTIRNFMLWCDNLGEKINDDSIDTEKIIENVLIPKPIGELPEKTVLCIDWPVELLQKQESRITLVSSFGEFPFSQYGIKLKSYDRAKNQILFDVIHDSHSGTYSLALNGDTGSELNPPSFVVNHITGTNFKIDFGNSSLSLQNWFSDYPPEILFVDGDELRGCDLIELKDWESIPLPQANILSWNWDNTDIKKESMWKNGQYRNDSIQHKVFTELQADNFDLIFNDDSKGEVADLICIKELDEYIQIKFVHCKFSGKKRDGKRIKDVIEVCSQAIKSSRWIWKFKALCSHLSSRESKLKVKGMKTRYLKGDDSVLKSLIKASRYKEVKTEIIIVQPGIKKGSFSKDQSLILSSAHSYLLDTVNIGLNVVCS